MTAAHVIEAAVRTGWPPCQDCGGAVTRETGVLSVDYGEIREHEHARVAWEREHPGAVVDLADVPADLGPIRWCWGHAGCLPDRNEYTISAARLDTPGKLLGWTAHLTQKRWFASTDWAAAIRLLYGREIAT